MLKKSFNLLSFYYLNFYISRIQFCLLVPKKKKILPTYISILKLKKRRLIDKRKVMHLEILLRLMATILVAITTENIEIDKI